ncbi:MAG: FKBP-type peptidyl-prolyl cis-trans isomerase [Bacteroidaceae bacterium]|nr:FKBP-type peptidyl-prolyl cis-trans isomerase [Bacteroidaceae bacterium]
MKKIFLFVALVAATVLTSCNGGGKTGDGQIDSLSYMIGMASGNPEQIAQYLAMQGSDSTFVEDFVKGLKEGMSIGDNKKKLAYFQGVMAGMQTQKQLFSNVEAQIFGSDSTRHLSETQYLLGLSDGLNRKTKIVINGVKCGPEQAAEYVDSVFRKLSDEALARQYAKEKKASEEYMAKIAKTAGVKPLGNGVYYKVITEGAGEKLTADATARVKYEGRLIDGTVFDQSKEGEPSDLRVGGVVPGFKAALLAMPVGSVWEVYIPYDQAYGANPMGDRLPAFSTLIFKIELVGKK